MILKNLALINKGLKQHKKIICIPYSKSSIKIVQLLYDEGYIFTYKIIYNKIILEFNMKEGKLMCNGIRLYKKNNNKSYISYNSLKKINDNNKKQKVYYEYQIRDLF